MGSDQLIAVTTDALRGLLQAALPAEATVLVGPPSPDVQSVSGLSLHLYRIGLNAAFRNQAVPSRDPSGARLSAPPVALELDYLISGLGGEPLQELGLLGGALRALADTPRREREELEPLLSQPDRLSSIAAGGVTLQLTVLDLPVEQQCQVWVASGMKQRGGVFCRAEAVWHGMQG